MRWRAIGALCLWGLMNLHCGGGAGPLDAAPEVVGGPAAAAPAARGSVAAGPGMDAGPWDGGVADAAAEDASAGDAEGPTDAEASDAEPPDAGFADGATGDAEPSDAATKDAEPSDAAAKDAEPSDAGLPAPDAGSPDGGTADGGSGADAGGLTHTLTVAGTGHSPIVTFWEDDLGDWYSFSCPSGPCAYSVRDGALVTVESESPGQTFSPTWGVLPGTAGQCTFIPPIGGGFPFVTCDVFVAQDVAVTISWSQ